MKDKTANLLEKKNKEYFYELRLGMISQIMPRQYKSQIKYHKWYAPLS